MTMYERSIDDFLSIFYAGMESKLKRIIQLNSTDQTSAETKELYETKSNLLEALDYLYIMSNDSEMKRLLGVLASLVSSTNNRELEQALNFCSGMKSV